MLPRNPILIKPKRLKESVEEASQKSLKEPPGYIIYTTEEFSMATIADPDGIIHYANDNFFKISKYDWEELIGQDPCIISSGGHLNPNPHAGQSY